MLTIFLVTAGLLYGIGLRADRLHAQRTVKEPELLAFGHAAGAPKGLASGSSTVRDLPHSAGYYAWQLRVRTRQYREAHHYARVLERYIRARRHHAPTRTLSDSSVWDRLGSCESGYGGPANWSLDTGNGFFGGLQWLPSTWWAYGGHGMPQDASRDEQIVVAERVLAAAGGRFTDWPACRAKLGLP